MAYVKQTWVNTPQGGTPLAADRLNHMEDGIADVDARVTELEAGPGAVKPFPPVALSDATTIATDASLGTHFRVTISGNRTLGVPSNPTDGQVCVWEVTASGNDRTLTLSSSTGGFEFGADVTEVPTIAEDTTTYIQAVYNASANRWRVIGVVGGY